MKYYKNKTLVLTSIVIIHNITNTAASIGYKHVCFDVDYNTA